MKSFATIVAIALSLSSRAYSTTATLTKCDVQHGVPAPCNPDTRNCFFNSNAAGNRFVVHFESVDSVSESTICGHSNDRLFSAAKSFSTNILGEVLCSTFTDQNGAITMDLQVMFDKQSPQVQLNALVLGLTASFGSAGSSISPSTCDLSQIPV